VKGNGTCVAVGYNAFGQCDLGNWKDIVAVACGSGHTLGLKADGTVAAIGRNDYGQCNVANWHDVIDLAAHGEESVGLRADGTVVFASRADEKGMPEHHNYGPTGKDKVEGWKEIVAIGVTRICTLGIKADGTTVYAGWRDPLLTPLFEQWNVGRVDPAALHVPQGRSFLYPWRGADTQPR
jgi:hypothetical protein